MRNSLLDIERLMNTIKEAAIRSSKKGPYRLKPATIALQPSPSQTSASPQPYREKQKQ